MDEELGPVLDLRDLFVAERAERAALLEALPAEAWSVPTVCPGWDVHDLVAHLVNDHVRRLSGSRDGHAGAVFADGETLPAHLARVNDEFVRAMRQASPRVLLDQLAVLGPQLDTLWAERDLYGPADLPVPWADGRSAWLDIAREYTEFWVHHQQLRDAVHRPGATDPHLMRPVLDTFARALPHTLRRHARPEGTVVRLVALGPAGGRWHAERRASAWRMLDTAEGTVDAEVVLDQDDLWRLATRGISPEQALRRATTAGDAELVDAVAGLLAVIA